jgi:hypothetical protein
MNIFSWRHAVFRDLLQAMEHVTKSRAFFSSSTLVSFPLSVLALSVYIQGILRCCLESKNARSLVRRCSWSDADCCIAMPGACFINPAPHTRDSDACVVAARHSRITPTAQTPAPLPSIKFVSYTRSVIVVQQRRVQTSQSSNTLFLAVSRVVLSTGPGLRIVAARIVHLILTRTTQSALLQDDLLAQLEQLHQILRF